MLHLVYSRIVSRIAGVFFFFFLVRVHFYLFSLLLFSRSRSTKHRLRLCVQFRIECIYISLQITCLRFVFYCSRVPLGCFLFAFLYLLLPLLPLLLACRSKCTRLHIHSFSLFLSFFSVDFFPSLLLFLFFFFRRLNIHERES